MKDLKHFGCRMAQTVKKTKLWNILQRCLSIQNRVKLSYSLNAFYLSCKNNAIVDRSHTATSNNLIANEREREKERE